MDGLIKEGLEGIAHVAEAIAPSQDPLTELKSLLFWGARLNWVMDQIILTPTCDKSTCKVAIIKLLAEDGIPEAAHLVEYGAQFLEGELEGHDMAAKTLVDLDGWFSQHNAVTPDWLHNVVKFWATKFQTMIRAKLGGVNALET